MKLSRYTSACVAAFCLLSSSLLNAQDDSTRNSNNRAKDGDRATTYGIISPQENDRQIARWLITDQHAVIECSKMAQERSTNDNVKQFAQTMVTEHSSCLDKLEGIRKQAANTTDTAPATVGNGKIRVEARRSGIVVKDEDGQQRDGKMVYHPTDFVQVKEEICNQMKATMAKEMKAMPGSEFDRAYMKHMVMGHEALLATCKVVRKTASKDMQAMLDQDIEKLNGHLKQARELCDQVCGTTKTGKLDSKESIKNSR